MEGSIFLLSRQVTGDHGESFTQNLTVFARDADHARALAYEQFAKLRALSSSPEKAYQEAPPFTAERVVLKEHKLITAGVTFT
jgi:hypothetical protein